MTPTIGRIVRYCLSQQDAAGINRRRVSLHLDPVTDGYVFHTGNHANAGDVLPATIVRVNGRPLGGVNAQVLLDGNDTLWVTGVMKSEGPLVGCWHWPPRVPA